MSLILTATGPATTAGIQDVLEADFARARAALAEARREQAGKDTPRHRATVAECTARVDAVLDMYLAARAARVTP
ncbi:hypothetical protein [Geodermatophilus sabuli]|uniref:Uncharacterized protein n=1 Tax=Geodermatophilus sabuli TaxID=1564158 RepID=A0A285EH87_9ACTN|nr:hypothetical protein [Geodermatophilus sabuli]MBB3086219.1 hypothetical protein [Geodermatophilus sabuli]SNX97564.1 hypothetical protein SAMN06893097_107208 [Geodermatophilus sabuli]